jgi:hypothetical protein
MMIIWAFSRNAILNYQGDTMKYFVLYRFLINQAYALTILLVYDMQPLHGE